MVGQKQDGLEGELPVAEIEQILERRTEKIDDHRIVVTLGTEPADKRNTDATSKGLVNFGLVLELWVLGLDGLELDGDFLTGDQVDSEVNVTC